SPDIHWPSGFEPEKADLFAHNELIINASCERVWRHIIDANRWPTWYPNSKDVEIQGGDPVLGDGTVFRWTTFGLAIESKVHEYV
ncbi:SRPBCC family protein, partial [Salmonella sp. SAL04284]|uniref:SRPBCC family protein n=1 Tax=Salmonella sp. SAL04284 TaxID=3159862 RepID=UPI00397DC009